MLRRSLAISNSNGRRERVKRVTEERVVAADEAPLVLTDVVDFARHVVVATDHIYFVLEEERLVADAKLVHRVQTTPSLALHIEQMHFAVSICVLAADKDDLSW